MAGSVFLYTPPLDARQFGATLAHPTIGKSCPPRGTEVNVQTTASAQSTLVELESAAKDSPESKTAPEGPFASSGLVAGARFRISESLLSRSESS